jgi:hypothetical protein
MIEIIIQNKEQAQHASCSEVITLIPFLFIGLFFRFFIPFSNCDAS